MADKSQAVISIALLTEIISTIISNIIITLFLYDYYSAAIETGAT